MYDFDPYAESVVDVYGDKHAVRELCGVVDEEGRVVIIDGQFADTADNKDNGIEFAFGGNK